MRVLIAEKAQADYARRLEQVLGPDLELVGSDDPQQLPDLAADCQIWLGQPDLLAQVLREGPKPQWLQSTWAGITPFLADGLPRDYLLSRAVGIFGQVMTEYVLCHMLAHERQISAQQAAQARQQWRGELPQSLAGRRVLIVGCGDIGHSMALFLAAFGVELHGIASQAREQGPFIEVASISELPRMAAEADYLINLLPDTPATQNIYNSELFALLKPSAMFINAGRGAAVVDEDLVSALQADRLAAAVIDVCRVEPLPAGHMFWTAPRLLLTGHSSAPTQPALMVKLFVDNLERFQAGQALQGLVDFSRDY
ncbi:D-2-hydroxyacid dehydrogenase [Pseudomonas segetis]|uniref:Phosphoglycerate dehydrogenase n=1 Tax=Pseudomonas segetis TaxID=298908 RepID=A0A238ZVM8_9PSED|nr:D-2-hydroxyacid dehydrogenase [Pseudomonas segetis]SNR87400.1 Phosphoglycerate dehydrogenase [Pseudomonas segetis]